ncbi:MAG TPA: glycosyltransferase family 4 protein [Candidatus Paceibacterota bacterium]
MFNILFLTHYSSMYGANQSMCMLMVELRAKYNIRPIVLLSQRGEICEFLDQNKIKYTVSHFYWWVNADKGIFQKLLNYRKQVRNLFRLPKLLKLVEREEIDLIYSNSITINIGVFLSRKMHCPHIWHIRETLQAYDFKYSLGKYAAKKIFENGADRYIVISDFLLNSYKGILPINRTRRIYNGLTLDIESKKPNSFTGILNIVIVGIICEQKNQFDALKALTILDSRGINNIKLHLVGGNKEDYLQQVNAYIDVNELNDRVIIHGHKTNLSGILKDMNVGIVCARDEAFGRVTIEYMLHRMPVIASKSGANEELVMDGENGLLYDLYNGEDLADKIEYFIKNPNQMETMGAYAQKYAKMNFSSEQNTSAIYKVIEELLESR